MIEKMEQSLDVSQEKELIKKCLKSKEEHETFEKYCNTCETNSELRTLFVRYRHLLRDVYPLNNGLKTYSPLQRPLRIGYLLNRSIVFFGDLDEIICNYIRNEGTEVIQFKYEDIYFKGCKNGIEIYVQNKLCEFDGFMAYGYRSKLDMESYLYILKMMELKGVVCLNSHYTEMILNDKLLQSIHFAKANVPIPDTYETFDVTKAKDLVMNNVITAPAVIKDFNDYGGDSVYKVNDGGNIVNAVAKSIWNSKNVLIQKFVPDSLGKSVRVLCINGKAFAMMLYLDKSGDFRSNVSMGENYECVSLMNNENFKPYKLVAENAVKAIGSDIVIGGVDLLDSKADGIVVLEVNSWPDILDIWLETKKCPFKIFAKSFIAKIKKSIDKKQIVTKLSPIYTTQFSV